MNVMKMKVVACAAAVLAGLVLRADEVVLTPGQVDVVLPKKAWPVEKFAAEELTNFLSRVLGKDVPVVRKPAADRAGINFRWQINGVWAICASLQQYAVLGSQARASVRASSAYYARTDLLRGTCGVECSF